MSKSISIYDGDNFRREALFYYSNRIGLNYTEIFDLGLALVIEKHSKDSFYTYHEVRKKILELKIDKYKNNE